MSGDTPQAGMTIRITGDGAIATMVIARTTPPGAVTPNALADLARRLGVVVDDAVLARLTAIAEQFAAQPADLEETFAEARRPVPGDDAFIEWAPGFDPDEDHCIVGGDGEGAVDHYNRVSYVRVAKGAHVATIHPPTPGTDGLDVTGRPIPATRGRSCELRVADGLETGDDGRIVSATSGLLQLVRTVLKVSRVFEVDGTVDFSTGNIVHDGTVVVKEGVKGRFSVQATEDVVIQGLIEAADIDCGGDFICRQGMAAKMRGRIRVGGNAEVGYLQGVKGIVRGSLAVQKELRNCQLLVSGDVTAHGAAVVAGSLSVGGRLHVAQLGAAACPQTTVVLGDDPAVAARLVRVMAGIRQLERRLEDTSELGPEELALVRETLRTHRAKAAELESERREATDRRAGELHVTRVIHPEVRLRWGERLHCFDGELYGPLRIRGGADGPLVTIAGGPERPLVEVAPVARPAA